MADYILMKLFPHGNPFGVLVAILGSLLVVGIMLLLAGA